MLIQFHMLQNYGPSNLNRDDTGSPKDTLFGGVQRGRISSQCLKRSIRKSQVFADAFQADGLLGERTKQLPLIIQQELTALGASDDENAAIVARVHEIGRESRKPAREDQVEVPEEEGEGTPSLSDEGAGETAQLIFIDRLTEARPLAQKLLEMYRKLGKKWATAKIPDITKEMGDRLPRSVDIAMFGRMTTSQAFKNVEAAVQVAHALSTNALKPDFDYFTAMDDLKPEGVPGADMIGDVEFNSCTYYKYLNVHWEELVHNLGGDKEIARRAVLALLEASATAQPSGKQNSFAALNLPDWILVEFSERNLPVNYANAFLKPAYGFGDQSLMSDSIAKFSDYVERLSLVYGLEPERAHIAVDGSDLLGAKPQPSLVALKKWLGERLV